MPKHLLPLVLLICVTGLHAKGSSLSGIVTDPGGTPIEGAVISCKGKRVYSLADGSFSLACDTDSLLISRLGYHPKSFPVSWQGSYVITPETINLPKITVSDSALDLFDASTDLVRVRLDPDRHYYSAADAMVSTSGFSSQDTRLKGETQALSILGNLSRHTLIVLDGVPLNPKGESYDLSRLDADNIEAIEVIKNNASVYGGASAIGGIVFITSRQGSPQMGREFYLNSELGSFGYAKASFSAEISDPKWKLRLKAGKFSADNDFRFDIEPWWSADSTGKRLNNAKRQNSISASLNTRLRNFQLTLQSEYENFYRQLPGTVNFSEVYRHAYLDGFSNRNRATLNTSFLGLDNRNLLWFNQDNTLYDNTRAPLAVYSNKYRQMLSSYGLRSSLGKDIATMADVELNTGISAEAGTDRYQNLDLLEPGNDIKARTLFANGSAKAGFKLSPGSLLIKAAGVVRHDHTEAEDMATWRAEGSFSRYGYFDFTLGGTYGTSFALPSPYDLYWKGDSQAIGNPDLKSETSRGWQIWGEVGIGRLNLKIAGHENTIKDLIQWRQVQMFGNAWKPVNIGKARIRNLEQETRFEPYDWLSLQGSLLLTEALELSALPQDEAPRLMYTPLYQASFSARFTWKGLGLWLSYSLTGPQESTPDNLTGTLEAYSLWDAGISYHYTAPGWELSPYLNFLNLLDRSYQVYPYTPQPGISVYGGISLKLSE